MKSYRLLNINYSIIYKILFFFIFTFSCIDSFTQEMLLRNFQPDEYISLDSNITLDVALNIINQLSTKYENKQILDSKERRGKIGVVVDNMHWKRALEYILRSNSLSYNEHPRHYEIIDGKINKVKKEKINLLTREIEINAIFFEADQQTLAELGIDWGTLSEGRVTLRMAAKSAQEVAGETYSLRGNYNGKSIKVFTLMKAIEASSKGRVIANPQIRIMEGQEGKIKVGKNFFLTTRDFAGNTRYSEYESGTILRVKPEVISKGKISIIHLTLNAEKSDVLPGATGVTKKITEGNTQVLLINGEETAIAGLISNEVSTARKGVPFLKDLPGWMLGLRYLFGFNSQMVTEKELIILIKAEIVPNTIARLKSKLRKINHLQKQKEAFNKKLKQFSGK